MHRFFGYLALCFTLLLAFCGRATYLQHNDDKDFRYHRAVAHAINRAVLMVDCDHKGTRLDDYAREHGTIRPLCSGTCLCDFTDDGLLTYSKFHSPIPEPIPSGAGGCSVAAVYGYGGDTLLDFLFQWGSPYTIGVSRQIAEDPHRLELAKAALRDPCAFLYHDPSASREGLPHRGGPKVSLDEAAWDRLSCPDINHRRLYKTKMALIAPGPKTDLTSVYRELAVADDHDLSWVLFLDPPDAP